MQLKIEESLCAFTYGVFLLDPSLRTMSIPLRFTTPMTALYDPKSIPTTKLIKS